MAQPYVGEIRMFAGNFAPAGWMFCEGQLLPISENETLFQLIGTTYGGDGQSTFALPDLRGRVPIHQGNGFILAETGGAEEITLTVNQIPAHTHALVGLERTSRDQSNAGGQRARAVAGRRPLHRATRRRQPSAPAAVAPVGGSQPHTNFQPYLCVDFIISLFGIFPSPDLRSTIMADPFVAEIRIFPFNFAPKGWAWCDGQLLPLSQNTALFSLLGTTYGGNGKSNFALPDLQGARADASRAGAGPQPARPRRDRRQRDRDAARVRDPGAPPSDCGRTRDLGDVQAPSPTLARSRARRAPTPTRRTAGQPVVALAPRRWRRPAATSRTTTCSRT